MSDNPNNSKRLYKNSNTSKLAPNSSHSIKKELPEIQMVYDLPIKEDKSFSVVNIKRLNNNSEDKEVSSDQINTKRQNNKSEGKDSSSINSSIRSNSEIMYINDSKSGIF